MTLIKIFFRIIWLPLSLFLLTVVFLRLGVLQAYPGIDIPLHFFGGLSIAVAGAIFLRLSRQNQWLGEINSALFFLFLFSFVGSATALWEVLEFGGDRLLSVGGPMQRGLFDTMKDIVLGLCGGLVGALVFSFRFKRGRGKNV